MIKLKYAGFASAALLLGLMFGVGVSQAAEINAAALYHDYCSVCHGDKGDGKSHAMRGLVPPPRDFTTPQSATELTPERIRHAIREGVPGSAMTAWKSRLSEQQISALADYVQTAFVKPVIADPALDGGRIYADYCSVCHGDSGRGAVWATSGLVPPPVDFTAPQVQQKLDRARMIQAVAYGRPETAMAGWKNRLTDQQIEIVVDYVIDSFMKGGIASTESNATPNSVMADMGQPMPMGLVGDVTRGAALYMANCTACHGVTGDGRGPRAYFINPKPRNFLHTASRANFNRPVLYESVAKGKLRSEMPAWDKVFTSQQLADVSEYVFQTFIRAE